MNIDLGSPGNLPNILSMCIFYFLPRMMPLLLSDSCSHQKVRLRDLELLLCSAGCLETIKDRILRICAHSMDTIICIFTVRKYDHEDQNSPVPQSGMMVLDL